MSDRIWIDAIETGRKIGVPEKSFIPPIPGETRMVTVQNWNGEYLQKAIELISPCRKQGGTAVVTGHVDAWVILGLAQSLMPECTVMYGAGLDGPDKPAVATPLLTLRMGEKNPKLRFDYRMKVEGDNCYLDYRVDDPDPPRGVVHTFNNEELPNLVLPVIPPEKHLFLYAKACYYVQVNVTYSYSKYALSVSTAYQDAEEYHCAWSSVPAMKAGDAAPRPEWSGI